ncbi:MAG: right-handed parallel beta-helix repeat-containing protein [Deltaproteobacteria bacterium]|nr:right-handed parallel beta-helix repeat-containing protein [Deltaproteobacteria bacterium]
MTDIARHRGLMIACLAACGGAPAADDSQGVGSNATTQTGSADGTDADASSGASEAATAAASGGSTEGGDDDTASSTGSDDTGDDTGPPPPPECGDGSCGALETCSSCADDCGACPENCDDPDVLCVDDAPGSEFSTIQDAVDAAVGGDTVLVFAGAYAGFQVDHSGEPGARIEIRAAEPGVQLVDPADGPTVASSCDEAPAGICIVGSDELAGVHDVVIEGFEIAYMPRSCVVARSANPGVAGESSPHLRLVIRTMKCTQAGHEGFYLSQVGSSLIEGNDIVDAGANGDDRGHGIYMANAGCDDSVLRGNTIHWDGALGPPEGAGIHLNGDLTVEGNGGGDGVITGITIEGNRIWGADHNGINMDGVRASRIAGNLIYGNARHAITGYAIDAAAGPADLHIVGNTLVVPSFGTGAPIRLHEDDGGHVFFDNIALVEGGGPSISVESTAIVSDYNVLGAAFAIADEDVDLAQWQAEGLDTNSLVVSDLAELFVGASDHHLVDGAVAIDAGIADLAEVAAPVFDLDGVVRPVGGAHDIGAYER